MPDVISIAPADVRLWVAWMCTNSRSWRRRCRAGGTPEVMRIETTQKAIRRLIALLGGPQGLAVCYEAGPGGFALWRLLSSLGVACDIVAPSLVPVRAGDRVKTDRRDARSSSRCTAAGCCATSPAHARDRRTAGSAALPRRSALRADRGAPPRREAAAAPRPRLPRRHQGLDSSHRAWVARQRLDDPLAHSRWSRC